MAPPIVPSSTFRSAEDPEGPVLYTRYGNNPNHERVGRIVAGLEGAEDALVLGSGMAAIALSFLALTREGDHVVASRLLYGYTRELLEEELPRRGIRVTTVDARDPGAWREALRSETRVLYLEVPTNPHLRVVDPRPVAALAREIGAALVVDATFASPINFRPLEHGADAVVHSATKYLGGHSDLTAGVVAGRREFIEEVRRMLRLYGPVLDPQATWLLERSLRTLAPRVDRQNRTALALARALRDRPEVASVIHPGLPDHPDHRVAAELFDGYGGMMGMILEGGGAAADRFMERVRLAVPAPSLGGPETLLSQPRHTSHRSLSSEERARLGMPDGFVRVSVGLEEADDLLDDFVRALEPAP